MCGCIAQLEGVQLDENPDPYDCCLFDLSSMQQDSGELSATG